MRDLMTQDCLPSHTVRVSRCSNCVLKIAEPVESIVLDSCERTSIICGDVATSFKISHCKQIELMVEGSVETIQGTDMHTDSQHIACRHRTRCHRFFFWSSCLRAFILPPPSRRRRVAFLPPRRRSLFCCRPH